MKLLITLFVAFVTLFVTVAPAEASNYRYNRNFSFGSRPSSVDSTQRFFYEQTRRRFQHPDVQNHLYERINYQTNRSLTERGVTGNGSLTWQLQLTNHRSENAWSAQGSVVRVCRNFTVRFEIQYRQMDRRDFNRVLTRHTSVRGTLCSPNGGHTWYAEAPFTIN